jgi:hypothetical protein
MLRHVVFLVCVVAVTVLIADVPFTDDFERSALSPYWVNSGGGVDWGIDDATYSSPTRSASDSPGQKFPLSPSERWMAMASGVNLSGMISALLEYNTYYDVRAGKDACHVQVSVDGGEYWQDIEQAYSGNGGWEHHTVDLSPLCGNQNVKVRFLLAVWPKGSPKDGWYIDDVTISREAQPRHDCGASDILAPMHNVGQNDSVTPTALYSNFGNQVDTFWAHFKFEGGQPAQSYHESLRTVLPVAGCTTLTFRKWYSSSLGNYNEKAWTAFSRDEHPENDTAYEEFEVIRALRDVGPYRISAPGTSIHPVPVRPAVWIRNNGTELEHLAVFSRICEGSDTVFAGADSLVLAAGDTAQVIFSEWPASYGVYRAKFFTVCSADWVSSNDTTFRDFSVDRYDHDVGVASISSPVDSCMAGPVTPSVIVRNYGINSESFITHFEILDSLGELVRHWQQTVSGLAGDNLRLVTFTPDWNATYGSYVLRSYTEEGIDQNHVNDTATAQFIVHDPRSLYDAAVISIASPLSPTHSGWLTPQAWVTNCGLMTESFNASFKVIDSLGLTAYEQVVPVGNLGPNGEALVTFPMWGAEAGVYDLCCWSDLATDMDHSNDTVRASLHVADSVAPELPGGWISRAPIPLGLKGKRVKDGGTLAYNQEGEQQLIYAFKGNGTNEFYRYLTQSDAWFTSDSIPKFGRESKKRGVKKGGTLTSAGDKLYATKGGGSLDFWEYDPSLRKWTQLSSVPAGGRKVKDAASFAAVRISGIDYIYLLKASNSLEFYRYNVAAAAWETLSPAPLGASNKTYKAGSAITCSPDLGQIYVLKGSTNEFFSYSLTDGSWRTLNPLPLLGSSGRPKKVKDGASLTYRRGLVYALKGGNTNEFFTFRCDSGKWYTFPDMPSAMGNKKVKSGAAMAYASVRDRIYALKGANTIEFYAFAFDTLRVYQLPRLNGVVTSEVRRLSPAITALPNPVSRSTRVRYELRVPGRVRVRLYDVAGAVCRTLTDGYQPAGRHEVQLDCRDIPNGVYLLHYEDSQKKTTCKLVVER